ncbi:hypothetical protein RJ640_029283, partial [Escallonia rubra]
MDWWLKDLFLLLTAWCNEIHVGPIGHPFKSCRGQNASIRKGHHEWVDAVVEDIAYHLFDGLVIRIPHAERFSITRVPAVVELCIQAGVDLLEFPTKKEEENPVIRIAKSEFVDADESELPDLEPECPKTPLLAEIPNAEICGFVVRVGSSGHKAQNCGAHKHQQRNGQHGWHWQAAVLDDLIRPRYAWHVPDLVELVLKRELRNFYGQAPVVVEFCVQGGAVVPEQYKPATRLD